MKRVVETKFYPFVQNNSGGYFVADEKAGVCEYVIIEAQNAKEANSKLESIGDNVSGFWNYCSCCGSRWSDVYESEGTKTPMLYETDVKNFKTGFLGNICFIHYYNGKIEKIEFDK